MKVIEYMTPFRENRIYLPEHKAKKLISVLHEWYKCGRNDVHGISLQGRGRGITITAELFAKTVYPAIYDREFSENDDAIEFAEHIGRLVVETHAGWFAACIFLGYNEKSHIIWLVICNSVEDAYFEIKEAARHGE